MNSYITNYVYLVASFYPDDFKLMKYANNDFVNLLIINWAELCINSMRNRSSYEYKLELVWEKNPKMFYEYTNTLQ